MSFAPRPISVEAASKGAAFSSECRPPHGREHELENKHFPQLSRILVCDGQTLSALVSAPTAIEAFLLDDGEVWLADVVIVDIVLGVGSGERGAEVVHWLDINRPRLQIHLTLAGEGYRKSTKCWQMIGCPEDTRPMWRHADDITRVFDVMRAVEELGGEGLLLVSDHDYIRRCLQHFETRLCVTSPANLR